MSSEKLLYYEFDEYRLDILNGKLLKDNESIELTPKSLEILFYLIKNHGRLLRKKELLQALWADTFVDESNLIQHIYLLRKILKQNSKGEVLIETVPKTGYRFVGQVREVFEEENEGEKESLRVENNEPPQIIEEPKQIQQTFDNYQNPLVYNPPKSRRIWVNSLIILGFVVPLSIYLFLYQNFLFKTSNRLRPNSIAVLPFHQINPNSDDKDGLGIADVIISQLAKLENVQITPTSSIIQYAENKDLDPFEAGSQLEVDYVLIGNIQYDGEIIRITYQVFSIRDKKTVISDKIDGKFTTNFSMQDMVSEHILRQVAMTINNDKSLIILNYN